ncbi:hypothetical protein ACFL6X_02065 [Candidatus Latescibacterota bacterium]
MTAGDVSLGRRQVPRDLRWFLASTFAATYGCVYAWRSLEIESGLVVLIMAVPMSAAMLTQKVVAGDTVFKGKGLGFALGRKRHLFFAPFVTWAVILVIYAISCYLDPGLFRGCEAATEPRRQ